MNTALHNTDINDTQPVDLFNDVNSYTPLQLENLPISQDLKDCIDYFELKFSFLVKQFCSHCDAHFPSIQFLNDLLGVNSSIPSDTSLAVTMQHSFPMLYGLTSQKHNPYQKLLLVFLSDHNQDTETKTTIRNILTIFYQLAKTKHIPHILHHCLQQATDNSPTHARDHQRIIQTHIETCCDEITNSLRKYSSLSFLNHTDIDTINDMISRIQCYQTYIRKHLKVA